MIIATRTPAFDLTKASFKTHLNYIKCVEKLFLSSSMVVVKNGTPIKNNFEILRFKKLYRVTLRSIKKDIELAREDPDFAGIVTPWFPVKCYYALYYLESILIHLVDGSTHGFTKGGHTGVRKKLYSLVSGGSIDFSNQDLNKVYLLTHIQSTPSINSGENTRHNFWQKPQCVESMTKKLLDYKLHDAKVTKKWNLHTLKGKTEKKQFLVSEKLMITDFFYWYRIKANYRDLDYVDFEGGISSNEVLEYLESYNNAFESYGNCLVKTIKAL